MWPNECKQTHVLHCKAFIGSNQLVTYIPNYEEIFINDNVEEQFFFYFKYYDGQSQEKEDPREVNAVIAHMHLPFVCCCTCLFRYELNNKK